jgi:hypothetical protein
MPLWDVRKCGLEMGKVFDTVTAFMVVAYALFAVSPFKAGPRN